MYNELESILNKAFKKIGYEVEPKVVKSKEEFVDFQCDNLFSLAKTYHKAPLVIGEEVISEIKKMSDFSFYFKSVELAKPGFINICVSDRFINESLRKLITKDSLGCTKEQSTIVIDYGGPNVAKPLHVGHLRTAIIGQAIYNILKFKGNKVIGDVHLGDIGLQMGQVIYGIINDFPNTKYEDIEFDLEYLNKTYPKVSALCKEDDDVKEKCHKITKELQDGNEEYVYLWKKIMKISLDDIKRLYEYLSVDFDYWYGESDAYKYFDEMIPYIESKGLVRIDDGAKIIDVKEDSDKVDVPPLILQKSDGAYLYSTSDLATIWQRKKDFDPDDIIYVTDDRQSLHFEQVFRVARKAHIYEKGLEHHGYGTVNGKDNKPFKTRSGGTLKLDDLISEVREEFINLREENKKMDKEDLDKIVNSIIKFADLQNDMSRNYIFDIKKFSEVNGKTGPYILYTYLRISKLLSSNNGLLSDNIYNDIDRDLRLKLIDVPVVIDQSARERKPHYIANYVYELSVLANNFYVENRMTDIDDDIKNDYDIVLSFNNKVLKSLLSLLGIYIPKSM